MEYMSNKSQGGKRKIRQKPDVRVIARTMGEFERVETLSSSIIFSDMRGENAGFPKEQTPAFVVGNPFPAPPSPGNPAGFQKAGLLRTKKNFSCDQMPSTYRAQQVNSHSTCENCDMNRVM